MSSDCQSCAAVTIHAILNAFNNRVVVIDIAHITMYTADS